MPSFLNNLGASFLPQQRRPLINQNAFGYNQQLPTSQPYQSNAQTQQDAEDDFLAQYGKISSNRPNRLAYQQGVQEGPPKINRGKWAKLGALLAAGGAGLGGTPASQAAQLGISAYETPQRESDENYKQKMAGLGNLAQFEDSDISEKLKALEMQRGEHWKTEENRRQNEELGIKRTDSQRAADVAKLQMDEIRDRMARLDVEEYTDKKTGIKYKKNLKTGDIQQIGQVDLTPEEASSYAASAAGAKTKAEEGAKAPFEAAHDTRVAAGQMAVAKEGTERAKSVADIRAASDAKKIAARLREKANTMKPDDVMKNIYLDMAVDIDNEDLPADAAQYITFENGIPSADAGMWGNKQTAALVRDAIARSIAKSRGGGNQNQTPAPDSNINSVTGKPKTNPLGLPSRGRGGRP